jgi:hypothetical protein
MKRFVVLAAGLAVVAALVCGRSFLATAQQPAPDVQPPRPPTTYAPAPPAAVPASKDITTASLPELVQMLKTVRQQKAELKLVEEKITTTIRQKIEEEKKQHETVQQLLDNPEEEKPTIGSRR